MPELDLAALPKYTPLEPLPKYSCEPSSDERTLQETPCHSRTVPNGTYIQRSGKISVILYEQESGGGTPRYGRNGEISGSIIIEKPHEVSRITLKVEGKLDTKIPVCGPLSIRLFDHSCISWRKGDGDKLSSHLPFSHLLPRSFIYEGSEHDLPPTFSVRQVGFDLRATYSITICVSRARHAMNVFPRSHKVKIPFNYCPRIRPHRPILMNPNFFSAIKTSPEEWYQTSSAMQMRRDMPELGTVHCDLFIPGGRVYSLTDKIPFHVQLNGHTDAFQILMPQPVNGPLIPSRCHKKFPLQGNQLKIKVSLYRQIRAENKGEKSFNNTLIGESEISESPPGICESSSIIHLDWQGEANIKPDVMVGGFIAGNVSVKDFVVLILEPPPVKNDKPSPFYPLQMTVPIRLVTDSFEEVYDYEPPPV
ncbi:hypothetical protein E4T56_gene17346 [Termitomyces sp. T112]|nr:hypothetical protein E4T56_gene17346 [Termitomyces sp. T112]